jgi:hypothetical protein
MPDVLPFDDAFEFEEAFEPDEWLPLESLRILRSLRPLFIVPVVVPAVAPPFIVLLRLPAAPVDPVLPGAVALDVPVDVVPAFVAVLPVDVEVEPVPVCAKATAEAAPMAITEAIARERCFMAVLSLRGDDRRMSRSASAARGRRRQGTCLVLRSSRATSGRFKRHAACPTQPSWSCRTRALQGAEHFRFRC